MFCTNCEFEINGEGRKECPICGGPLIEYAELETSSEETKSSWEAEKDGATAQGSKEITFFDLESALKTDDEIGENQKLEDSSPSSFALEPEPDPVVDKESTEDIVASAPDEYGPSSIEETCTTVSKKSQLEDEDQKVCPTCGRPFIEYAVIAAPEQSELKPGRSSRVLPTITIIAILAVVAAFGSIAFLKPQLKRYPVIAQLKTETEKTVVNIFNIITKKDKKKVVAEKEPEPLDSVQRAQKEIFEEKAAFVKEISILDKTFEKGKEEKALVKKEPEPTISSAKTAKKEVSPKKIVSLREIPPTPEKKVVQTLEMKMTQKVTAKKKRVPIKPVEKKTTLNGIYSIHAGSYRSKKAAASESSRLKKLGFNPYIQTADFRKEGQVWHRIKIGDFNTREEAQKVRGDLSQKDPALKSLIIAERAQSK